MTAFRLGVLGGSFNPVHHGHLHVARRCRDVFGLSRILFVVTAAPPHKPPEDLTAFIHRYAMVTLATADEPNFIPSAAEIEPPVSPYSVDTLAKLARSHNLRGNEVFFIAGGDSLLDVAGWHESARLLSCYNFIFVMRPGVTMPEIAGMLPAAALPALTDCRGLGVPEMQRRVRRDSAMTSCRIYIAELGAPDIAASQIRRLAGSNQPIDSLVPAAVADYISKLHLYGE